MPAIIHRYQHCSSSQCGTTRSSHPNEEETGSWSSSRQFQIRIVPLSVGLWRYGTPGLHSHLHQNRKTAGRRKRTLPARAVRSLRFAGSLRFHLHKGMTPSSPRIGTGFVRYSMLKAFAGSELKLFIIVWPKNAVTSFFVVSSGWGGAWSAAHRRRRFELIPIPKSSDRVSMLPGGHNPVHAHLVKSLSAVYQVAV